MHKFLAVPLLFCLLLTLGCTEELEFPADNSSDENTENSSAENSQENADENSSHGDETGDNAANGDNAEENQNQDDPYPVEGVEVSHDRELRGAWIPTVFNISWPSRSTLSMSAQQNELRDLLDVAQQAGLNTVFFQIRSEADAFYPSDIEPWSRFLTGTMGRDPGWDPLAFAIEEAHKRGLELHAWLNPYRALASGNSSLANSSHIIHAQPHLTHYYNNLYWIDPGLLEGQAHTVAVIHDILARYDVDGIHFDDYFYPYPSNDPFPDAATYQAYRNGGGTLSLGDFRRQNVHDLVETVYQLISQERPDVRFGISPFGIYRPGIPEGITGLDQYAAIYADPLRWLEEGWVDYIAPQLYWPTTQTAQAYEVLLHWWADQARAAGKDLYVGNYTSQLGSSSAWTVAEILKQIRLTRQARDKSALGNIHYHINPLKQNQLGITTSLVSEFYKRPAAAPPIPGALGRPPMPRLSVSDQGVKYEGSDEIRYFAVYRDHELLKLVPGVEQEFGLPRGEYLISAIDRIGRESLGHPVVVEVDSAPPIDFEEPAGPSCTHTYGGVYGDGACSGAYQCCGGDWKSGHDQCGACTCIEATGQEGC